MNPAMQNTASMWVLLCEELEARRSGESAEACSAAARRFEQAAKEIFKSRPERLRDALEIAGDIHQASGYSAEALRSFSEAMALAGKEASPVVRARIATKLAIGHEAAGNLEEARGFYTKAIEAHDQTRDRSELPTLLNNLAGLHRAAGDFDAAEAAYERAMEEAVAVHGPHHPEVALIANNHAVACTDRGNLRKAEELHLRALQIREEAFGAIHPDVGQSMANLAVVYHASGQSRKAERFYLAALDTLANFHAGDSPEMERIRKNYNRLPHIRARRLSKTMKL
jgi:Tfp pilus assembly protein PilF